MLAKKEQFRKIVDSQFYQGNVMSIKQTLLLNNNESFDNEFIQKPPQYQLQYLQIDKGKLQSLNPKESSRTRVRNSSVSFQKADFEINSIQKLKAKISQLQALVHDLFSFVKMNTKGHLESIENLHQRFISIISNSNEEKTSNNFILYKLNNSIYGLTKENLEDENLTKETISLNNTIQKIDLLHFKGQCKKLILINTSNQELELGATEQNNLQRKTYTFEQNQNLKSIFLDQGESDQLTGYYEFYQNFSTDSISHYGQISDEKNDDHIFHDINILTYQGQIVGAQGIYRNDKEQCELIPGKPYINSNFLESEISDSNYDEDRQLQEYDIYQNQEILSIDKIVLKYLIISIILNMQINLIKIAPNYKLKLVMQKEIISKSLIIKFKLIKDQRLFIQLLTNKTI